MTNTSQNSTPSRKVGRAKLAAWGLITRLFEQLLNTILMLFITPIVISGLGRELYGAWLIILQSTSNLSRFDMRPNGTLRVTLAVSQQSDDYEEKRRQIGAALIILLIAIPFFVILGIVLVILAPSLLQLDVEYGQTARIAMGIAAFTVVMAEFSNMPSGILTGMNIYHRGIGVRALTSILGAVLMILVINWGWGLIGMAITNGVQVISGGVLIYFVTKRALPWLGIAKPGWAEIKRFLNMTFWLFMSSVAWAFLNSSELILIGLLLGSSDSAIYATTGIVIRNVNGLTTQLRNSTIAGMAELIGNQEWTRVKSLLAETKNILMAIFVIAGAGIIVMNGSFLELWLGPGFYSDKITNLFLILAIFADQIIGLDMNVAESLLALREQAIYTLLGGIVFIGLGAVLSPAIGLKGIAIAAFVSRIVLGGLILLLIMRRMKSGLLVFIQPIARMLTFCIVLFAFAFLFSDAIHPETWISFVIITLLLGGSFAVATLFIGLGRSDRKQLLNRAVHFMPSRR